MIVIPLKIVTILQLGTLAILVAQPTDVVKVCNNDEVFGQFGVKIHFGHLRGEN